MTTESPGDAKPRPMIGTMGCNVLARTEDSAALRSVINILSYRSPTRLGNSVPFRTPWIRQMVALFISLPYLPVLCLCTCPYPLS